MRMKRFTAILLALLLLAPLCFGILAGKAQAETIDDIWALITAYEDRQFLKGQVTCGTASVNDYASLCDGIIDVVESWNGYAKGSLIQNGEHLFWDGTDGVGYGYSPRLRQKVRGANATGADPASVSGIETFSYAARGIFPNSTDTAVFGPYYGLDTSFTDQYQNEAKSVAKTAGGICTVYKTDDATIDNIADALETCAVVFFDSHGDTDYYTSSGDYTSKANTSYLCIQSGKGITSADMKSVSGTYGSYKHAYYAGYGEDGMQFYCVDGTAIANHMEKSSPTGLLWMAICLGMATDGICKPMRSKGVEVVYGYSQSVTFDADYAWESYFWTKIKAKSTVKDAVAYMKQKGGSKDPYVRNYPAYPIVVSSEDIYPGHGKVDALQTVYSSWTLLPSYTIMAVSSIPAFGTVILNGAKITATPIGDYVLTGYTVTRGSAEVTQDGNIFTVLPKSNCTVQINFELRGDANLDGKVNSADAATVLRALVGLGVLSEQARTNAESDGAAGVSAEDALTILRNIVGLS